MDDIHDLEEDLGRKRFNYAASVLHRSEKQMPKEARSNDLLNRLRVLATTEQIYDEARTHVLKASAAIEPLEIPGMKKYLAHYLDRITPER